MAIDHDQATWPLRGLGYFLARPRLWLAPIAVTVAGWITILAVAILVLRVTWPDAAVEGWWANLLAILLALGWAGLTLVVGWLAAIPVLIGLAYEDLVKRVLAEEGIELGEERTISAIKSALFVLVRNLGWIVLWPTLALVCNLTGALAPLGVLLGQFGVAHIAILEAGDVALGARGVPGRERCRMLTERRQQVFAAALVGAVLSLVLGFTLVGWLLFFPAIFTGAALWIAGWRLPAADDPPRVDDGGGDASSPSRLPSADQD